MVIVIGSLTKYVIGFKAVGDHKVIPTMLDPRRIILGDKCLLQNKFSVNELERSLVKNLHLQMSSTWKNYQIGFKPISKYPGSAIIANNYEYFPNLIFYYDDIYDGPKKFRFIKEMQANISYLWYLVKGPSAAGADGSITIPKSFLKDVPGIAKKLSNDFQSNVVGNEENIKTAYRTYPDCPYSPNELRSLMSYCNVYLNSTQAVIAGLEIFDRDEQERQRALKIFRDRIELASCNWPSIYGEYLQQEHGVYFTLDTLRIRLGIYIALAILIFSLLHMVRRDAALVVHKKLRELGVTMNRRMIWRIVLTNWKLFFFPASDAKMLPILNRACEAVHFRQESRTLREQADAVWYRCRDLDGRGELQGDYRAASGRTKDGKLEHRHKALFRLLEGEQRLRQLALKWSKTIATPAEDTSPLKKPKREEPAQSNHARALEFARGLIPVDVEVELARLSPLKLERLGIVLSMIRPWHPLAVETFLAGNNLDAKLDAKSLLLKAALAGDKTIFLEELELAEKKVEAQEETPAPNDEHLLEGYKVVIVGGHRTVAKRALLTEIIESMGGKVISVVNTDLDDQLKDAIRGFAANEKRLAIYVGTTAAHSSGEILDSKGIKKVIVESLNQKRFKDQLKKQFQKAQSA